MRVHQLLPTFLPGDATGQSALHFGLLLRRLGLHGQIYAGEVAPQLRALASPASELRPQAEDLVLYHHGIASGLSSRLLHLPCRRGVIFHNISPYPTYRGTALAGALLGGRAQLAAMAPHVQLAIGVSDFNSRELKAAGYSNVHTVPLFVEEARFTREQLSAARLRRLQGPPTLLAVSRVMPHKRFEDVLRLHSEHRRRVPDARLWIVGGYEPGSAYFRGLERQARALGGVEFWGKVSFAQLVAAYRSASVFVSMSEHEGFGVPLLEAMAAQLPVLAFAAAAVPETLGGSGIGFTEKRYNVLAELVVELCQDAGLRQRVLEGQRRRLQELSPEVALQRLRTALAPLLPTVPARKRPAKKTRPRVAMVVQRYGELSGGAELLARMVAQRMAPHWQLTVLTTCARDHLSWKNEFPEGEQREGGVRVLRFPTRRTRELASFNSFSRRLYGHPNERAAEERWLAEQGPDSPGLLEHLADAQDQYDGYVFFTYLYQPTALGLPLVADRSIVVPTAHDEAPFNFEVFRDVHERPRVLFCSTPEEEALIQRRFVNHARTRIVGAGVEFPDADAERFRARHGVQGPYLFYVGRLEPGKGIDQLLEHHQTLTRRYADAPQLVLAGASGMTLHGARVRYLGRIEEQDKHDAIAGALGVVVPSRYESLSLLALEAFAQGTPVLANGASEVLVGQLERSGGGVTYLDTDSFIQGVRLLGEQRQALGARGLKFARLHTWERVVQAYREELERIVEGGR